MKKESFYFSHDYNARNDQKILQLRSEYGFEGYGVYWAILETMAETENGRLVATLLGGLAVGLSLPKERLLAMVEFCIEIGLFRRDEEGIFSQRMIDHKAHRKLLSDKGKEGSEKRWPKGKNGPPISTPNAKERKGKERIIPTVYVQQAVSFLNEATGKSYQADTQETVKVLRARENAGVTLDQIKQVITSKSAKWKDDPKMSEFLRPTTLFGNKFDNYLAESRPLKVVPQKEEIDFDDYTRPYFNRTS